MYVQRRSRVDQAGVDQRPDTENHPGGVATGIRDTIRLTNGLPLSGRKLRQAVHPVAGHAVRRAGIEEACPREEFHGFLGSVIGQAQHDDVGFSEPFAAPTGILALLLLDRERFDPVMAFQARGEFESRCAGLAVDEDAVCHCPGMAQGCRTTGGL